jgi:phosphoglycerate dehydrogenase-like enzyme
MTMMQNVSVLSRSFSKHPVLRAELQHLYPDATFNDDGKSLKGDELIAALKGHTKAIVALENISADVLDAVPELQVIAKYGVGFDKIDLQAMIQRNVMLGWTGGVNRRSVAELVIGFAISLLRRIPEGATLIRDGQWRQLTGRQLTDCTIGIIGCGHVGKDITRILRQAFNCNVLVYDLIDLSGFCAETGAKAISLNALLATSDVVSLHLPYDISTHNFLDAARLAQMKSDAILLNTARGGLVDEAALKEMLMNNPLAAAGFDVFSVEPPEDPELLSLDNFLASPHIGGSTQESILAMGRAAIAGLDNNRLPDVGIFPPGKW